MDLEKQLVIYEVSESVKKGSSELGSLISVCHGHCMHNCHHFTFYFCFDKCRVPDSSTRQGVGRFNKRSNSKRPLFFNKINYSNMPYHSKTEVIHNSLVLTL